MAKVTFDSTRNHFFKIIKEKTDAYFIENKLHPSGNRKLYIKGAIQVLTAFSLYIWLLFFTPPTFIALLACCLLGFNLAIIGFNIMHEGGHQSFSRHAWLNSLSAYFLNMLGGNAHFWKIKHNVNHHTYTNIDGLDSDIDVKPFMRLHVSQPWRRYHRFQHIYWIALYGISYVAWVFYEDFLKYFTSRIATHMSKQKFTTKEHIIFWVTKILYVTFYVALPVFILGWINAIVGFFIVTFICGLTTSIVFQLAHVVEGTTFTSIPKDTPRIDQEWAVHQVSATANFATKNRIFFWLLGGLNFQIEHHLFPRISHIHYPQISRFVKEACHECDIVYHEHSSMFKAFVSHLDYLRRLGSA
jgi:linoleoyl-CoA desaturase